MAKQQKAKKTDHKLANQATLKQNKKVNDETSKKIIALRKLTKNDAANQEQLKRLQTAHPELFKTDVEGNKTLKQDRKILEDSVSFLANMRNILSIQKKRME